MASIMAPIRISSGAIRIFKGASGWWAVALFVARRGGLSRFLRRVLLAGRSFSGTSWFAHKKCDQPFSWSHFSCHKLLKTRWSHFLWRAVAFLVAPDAFIESRCAHLLWRARLIISGAGRHNR